MAKRRRLLVLDDEPQVAGFLSDSLSERGFAAEAHTVPERALARLADELFDLVIADLEMPGMHGTDILHAIHRRRPEQLVVLMTAFGSIELAVAAVRAGAADFIAKPFRIEALELLVERAFRERQMRREIVRLRAQVSPHAPAVLSTRSPRMQAALDTARRVAKLDTTVLITGETGTGKGVIARFIHESGRRRRPFLHINCASLPPTLIESELFGVRRGAFTDARTDRPGAFVAAGDGTLFLDEIGELALETQAKLLHALEGGSIRALGASADTPIRARVVAATNQPLEHLLRQGAFRPDLYYRLNVIRVDLPPLRERREDILPLADQILARVAESQARVVAGVSAGAARRLASYSWPGNVRELVNVLERTVALCDHDSILSEDLGFLDESDSADGILASAVQSILPLAELERVYVRRVLDRCSGNKSDAARMLGIDRRTLYRKLSRARRPGGRPDARPRANRRPGAVPGGPAPPTRAPTNSKGR